MPRQVAADPARADVRRSATAQPHLPTPALLRLQPLLRAERREPLLPLREATLRTRGVVGECGLLAQAAAARASERADVRHRWHVHTMSVQHISQRTAKSRAADELAAATPPVTPPPARVDATTARGRKM